MAHSHLDRYGLRFDKWSSSLLVDNMVRQQMIAQPSFAVAKRGCHKVTQF